jgi:hypothetical protein
MKIKKITWRLRSDFYAIFECEFCLHTFEADGYQDDYFFNSVVPKMLCSKCKKSSNDSVASS